MEQQTSVIIDAGHGGAEPGAMFEGRKEKMIRSVWQWL